MRQDEVTDFGYEQVAPAEKRRRVRGLFDSVASRYDLMNDLMSFGVHRLWKRYAVTLAAPGYGDQVLDIAGGTGDMARLFARRVGTTGSVTICDISGEMLATGRDRLIDSGDFRNVRLVQGDAENLPFADASFNLACIAFGLRNVTDKPRALRSIHDKLRYGSSLVVLEFSAVVLPMLRRVYDVYSDRCIPGMGALFADDEASYRYLVESIRMHPPQEELAEMMREAGFTRVEYHNLSGGIVALHRGYRL